jgi:purine-nucleoside phosphorylase
LDNDAEVAPDPTLLKLLENEAKDQGASVYKGPQWTIDAPFRELKQKVSRYRKMGVLGVDMETSAMYALGQYRRVRVCNLLVVSDVLSEEWQEAFGTKKLKNANKLARAIIISCLSKEILSKTA